MKIHFVRHATIASEMSDLRVLVDPMPGRAGTAPDVPNTLEAPT